MEIGNEISQKIRSAIKAKLIEQGAYVDDELPDYIMVMVANKKSQKQMTDDLSLFLGTNTEKFTSWLHSLLKKLQSINTDEPAANTAHAKPKTKEKVKGEKRKHRSSQGDKEKKTETDKQRKSSTGEKEKTDKKKVEDKVEPGTAKVKPVQKAEEATIDELNIIENTDEFNDENVAAEVNELTQSSSTGKPPPTKVSKVEKSTDVKKSGTKSSVSSSKTRSSSSSSAKSRHDAGSSSRKKPSSIVASVKRRYEELDEDEEEYDPTNPAVGSVASVVRGPTRKSSIPQSLQANKSLLMKAVTEAEKSVTSKKISSESSKPAMRSDRQPVNLKHRLKTAAGLGLLSRSKRAEMSQKYTGSSTTTSQDSVKKPRKSIESFENISYTIKNVSTSPPKKVSLKAPATAPVRVATTALREIGGGSKVKQEVTEADSEDDDQEEYGPPLPDTRLVQKTNPDTDSNADSSQAGSPEAQPSQDDDDSPDPEIQLLLDEAHMTLDLNDDITEDEYKYQNKNTRKSTSPEPRFIVTLDGVDPDMYKTFSDVRQNPVQTVKPVPKPKPTTEEQHKPVVTPTAESLEQIFAKIQPPKIKPFNISLKDTDDEDEEEVMDTEETDETKSASINERCRFWPACANGNECQFIHPSMPCKCFPYCKFGDKCLYIHPNCRFDAKCTRMDCPYTHSSRRKGLMGPTVIHKILQVPVQQYVPQIDPFKSSKPFQSGNTPPTQCKFFPNCRNMSCPFTHPKPCRYGIGCMNKGSCTFSHPALPGADKLKWTSKDKKSTSEVPVPLKARVPVTDATK